MALELLHSRLDKELGSINAAIADALLQLPAPCQAAASHIIAAGGKRLRPFLTILMASLFEGKPEDALRLGACMEMLHAATLLHDDVLDNAVTRRGKAAAHTLYGVEQAILAGDALLALGNAIVASFGQPALCECYARATMQTAAGEILEMNSLRDPNLSEMLYLDIAKGKTGCLIAESCVMGAVSAKAPARAVDACREYGENLGIAFQLVDDALDFAPQSQTGKPRGGDLREGKLTQPLRLYRASLSQEDRMRFDHEFAASAFTDERLDAICMAASRFAGPSLVLAQKCLDRAKDALACLPAGEAHEILLQMLEYVRHRSK